MATPIYIPSRGRAHRVALGSLRYIPPSRLKDVIYVVPTNEVKDYVAALKAAVPKDKVRVFGISPKLNIVEIRLLMLKHAIDEGQKYAFQIDDDLAFYARREIDNVRLWYQEHHEAEDMFKALMSMLSKGKDRYHMVGVPARNGSNRFTSAVQPSTRIMQLQGYNLETVKQLIATKKLKADGLRTLEDHHFNLVMLRNGYPTAVHGHYAVGQPQTQAEGGCSHYRTVDSHRQDCERLASLHPGLVKLTTKSFKNSQNGFENRTEVVISWQKATAEGKRLLEGKTKAQVKTEKEKVTRSPQGRAESLAQGRVKQRERRRLERMAANQQTVQ